MAATKTHIYKGEMIIPMPCRKLIRDNTVPNEKYYLARWYVASMFSDNIAYTCEYCAQYRTLKDAMEAIDGKAGA